MSEKEIKEYLARMESFRREVTSSPQKARAVLVAAGICTPKGNLRKPYR